VMSSLSATTCVGSWPTSKRDQSCSVTSTPGVSHSPEPSPQPSIPESVSNFKNSHGFVELDNGSPVCGSGASCLVGTLNLYVFIFVIFMFEPR